MQITYFRTSASIRHRRPPVPGEARKPGTLVEYARFVEVQQRRARIIAELERPPEAPVPRALTPTAVDRVIDVREWPMWVDANGTRGDVDVR